MGGASIEPALRLAHAVGGCRLFTTQLSRKDQQGMPIAPPRQILRVFVDALKNSGDKPIDTAYLSAELDFSV